MDLRVEYCPGDIEVTVRGPENSPELLRILALLQEDNQRLWGWDEQKAAVMISPNSIVWAEMVDNKVFVYTPDAMYETSTGWPNRKLNGKASAFFAVPSLLSSISMPFGHCAVARAGALKQ